MSGAEQSSGGVGGTTLHWIGYTSVGFEMHVPERR